MPIVYASVDAEYEKNVDLKKEEVLALIDWAHKQPHLPNISELQAILFLHSCYYSSEQAKKTIDTYYTCRTHCPDFFANRDPTVGQALTQKDIILMCKLPGVTPKHNHKVYFYKILNGDASLFDYTGCCKRFIMLSDVWLLTHGTDFGHVLTFDMDGCSFGHVTKMGMSLIAMKKFFFYLQEALPFRLKGIYFINTPPFMDKILGLMKPFLKKELFDSIQLFTPQKLDEFYELVPKSMMPQEYGGASEPSLTLLANEQEYLIECRDWFKQDELNKADESKRPGKAKTASDLFGMEGSFKKLDID